MAVPLNWLDIVPEWDSAEVQSRPVKIMISFDFEMILKYTYIGRIGTSLYFIKLTGLGFVV